MLFELDKTYFWLGLYRAQSVTDFFKAYFFFQSCSRITQLTLKRVQVIGSNTASKGIVPSLLIMWSAAQPVKRCLLWLWISSVKLKETTADVIAISPWS